MSSLGVASPSGDRRSVSYAMYMIGQTDLQSLGVFWQTVTIPRNSGNRQKT